MFAINHATAALLLKRRFPRVPMPALLLSVQALELLWVLFNALGLERTTTEPHVHSVSEIHLVYIPFSHSLASTLVVAAAASAVAFVATRRKDFAAALALGVASHFVLDLVTHAADLALAPGLAHPLLGLGLYASAPMAAFAIELAFGVFCWWIYRGSKALLAAITLFNVANLSLFSAAIRGPEEALAGRPLAIVGLVFAQILVTLVVVGVLARPGRRLVPSRSGRPVTRARTAPASGTRN
jgi:membrane-bound metal-dependent hydrolase YbcI (DUF457 family)